MNASGCTPLTSDTDYHLTRQLILKRDDRPFGSEVKIHVRAEQNEPSSSRPTHSASEMSCLYSEALMKTQLIAFSLKEHNATAVRTDFNRRFVCIAQSDLTEPALVDELIQAGDALRSYGQALVVSLSERPRSSFGAHDKKKIIHHLYQLKDNDIEIAFDHYPPEEDSAEVLTVLNLFDYIKVSFSALDLSLKLNANPELFSQLYERMATLTRTTKVAFVADRVEHTASHILARALPFDYFQGSYYSPADGI
jgi:EAL domain-containing protein (putative c-di-GMP-specific phosphodiesterase class I)